MDEACPLCTGGRGGGGASLRPAGRSTRARARGRCSACRAAAPTRRPPRTRACLPKSGGPNETCPISTEGWTRRVHFAREGGGGGGVLACRKAQVRIQLHLGADARVRGRYHAPPLHALGRAPRRLERSVRDRRAGDPPVAPRAQHGRGGVPRDRHHPLQRCLQILPTRRAGAEARPPPPPPPVQSGHVSSIPPY